ncbi:MAG: tRNA (adenosine(37)-N6)-threonylcarbamoyltransferase complex ATPase subunit type 1 TsaE [Candidatus Chaera renei]|uniref:tRNA threonylcarbamoyladenosine biosynthesis protein TsaE n=1 Tax=Candidatus Chaera renei TaxID=2506947 RepID=A0A4Q0AJK8_9BACT|nr:MAG: tRNA (adenosine(37)-N6)-threonylcarbamoyltransferase complex ATPase subunit type 1 TsaE [Candidatus Chaera renei]
MKTVRTTTIVNTASAAETAALGERIGRGLRGGETIVLTGDIGSGKTTFVKGLARGLGCRETVQSPTFLIVSVYDCRPPLRLYHYDFYRLEDPGIMADQLLESTGDPAAVNVLEWSEIVSGVLPKNSALIRLSAVAGRDEARRLEFNLPDGMSYLLRGERNQP